MPTTLLTILAILLAPVVALRVSKWLDERRAAKERKMYIFRTLMTTRGAGLSPTHVEALNMIDVEFHGKDKEFNDVIEAWKLYRDHLFDRMIDTDLKAWTTKKEDFLIELLHEMALYLGYTFDKVLIKRGHYYPRGYGEIEEEQMIIRQGLVKLFQKKDSLPVVAWVAPVPEDEVKKWKMGKSKSPFN